MLNFRGQSLQGSQSTWRSYDLYAVYLHASRQLATARPQQGHSRPGAVDLAQSTWRSRPGAVDLAQSTWRSRPGAVDLAQSTWRSRPGAVDLAQSTWRSRPGAVDLAQSTSKYFTR